MVENVKKNNTYESNWHYRACIRSHQWRTREGIFMDEPLSRPEPKLNIDYNYYIKNTLGQETLEQVSLYVNVIS